MSVDVDSDYGQTVCRFFNPNDVFFGGVTAVLLIILDIIMDIMSSYKISAFGKKVVGLEVVGAMM